MEALVAGISAVVLGLVTVIGNWLSSRNDRALTAQELQLLKLMNPRSQAAKNLEEVIDARVAKWHRKAYRRTVSRTDPPALRRSASLLDNPFVAITLFAVGIFSMIWVIITS